MQEKFDFDGLFIYDMANNHQGSLEHGLNIIREIAKVSNEEKVKGSLKFQFRHLDTFIHSDYQDRGDVSKHIPRFLETRLSNEDFGKMVEEVRKNNLITISTPFDECSVDLIEKLDIDIIKIASCSSNDWPLIERITETKKPIVCSTAGLSLDSLDNLVNVLEQKNSNFALMHCIAIYPTPPSELQLNQIELSLVIFML